MSVLEENYDVAIVGAGHAGCEAALACEGSQLPAAMMFTVSVESIALMPCNPNIGGTSKGHLCGKSTRWEERWAGILTKHLFSPRC